MIDQKHVSKLISMSMDRQLSAQELDELRDELAMDEASRRLGDVMRALREMLGKRSEPVGHPLPEQTKRRLRSQIQAHFGSDTDPTVSVR